MSDIDGLDAFSVLLEKITELSRALERSTEAWSQLQIECRKMENENKELSTELAASRRHIDKLGQQKSYEALNNLAKGLNALADAGGFDWRKTFEPSLCASVLEALEQDDPIPF